MRYAISIKCLNDTSAPVFDLWDEASSFEDSPSMRELAYPPHITLAVFPTDVGQVEETLDEVFKSQTRISLTFESISYFENDHIVLWAKPRPCDALLDLHTRLHRHFDAALCHEHYRAGQWVPHCSLATMVGKSKAADAVKWAAKERNQFAVEFDTADFVSFPPVRVMKEYCLR
ncbi:2'-5' RNA ligase family protein [Agrobacterium rhizogenes]|uniref:2'-5' RNA ligase family protein n=1 Tax=Rhizobium rhizogenes TaxID=359 RepID=UPI00115E6439|nr:2'-5' RNA ligase family protein [Rhizobium rhizogenes]NTG25050.1 2'-5' RNA ligase family protein [Rhizobium rhizogenes]NTH42753.1 2'-5' RNA ligase family protein [Rhizobium rhizogenes]NTH55371.1 2'-5' RNA ligase family protein [Rhizobium rhizogenes]NTH74952.1 2'-5' RNA ligase family protein [Rhizobium rhizogenes]NTJ04901.1 2'-5' RNA ligase family protein [Rhizobium rhizogenes]